MGYKTALRGRKRGGKAISRKMDASSFGSCSQEDVLTSRRTARLTNDIPGQTSSREHIDNIFDFQSMQMRMLKRRGEGGLKWIFCCSFVVSLYKTKEATEAFHGRGLTFLGKDHQTGDIKEDNASRRHRMR